MYVIGDLDDQTLTLVWSKLSDTVLSLPPIFKDFPVYQQLFSPFIRPFTDYQPLASLVISLFFTLFGGFAQPVFMALTLFINFFVSYRFFKKYKVGLFLALLFTFSSYWWIHLGVHLILIQLWVFPFLFILVDKVQEASNLKSILMLGLWLALISIISLYYGFFSLLFLSIYVIVEIIFRKQSTKLHLAALGIGFLLTLILQLPNIYKFVASDSKFSNVSISRAYEDFFYFSSRPWYFFIPPTRNPLYGKFAEQLIDSVAATNYFLADDYFPREHSGNFFGYLFYVLVTVSVAFVLVKGPTALKRHVSFLVLLVVVLGAFMMPPFFTVSGLKLYTPSQLIFALLPVFRVSTRMVILIHLVLLMLLGVVYDFILTQYVISKRYLSVFASIVTVIILMETYIPPEVKHFVPPDVYAYMGSHLDSGTKFVVYPYDSTQEALLWLDVHKGLLVNPRGYHDANYDAESFTKALGVGDSLEVLKSMGTEYLVVFEGDEADEVDVSRGLEKVQEFSSSTLYKVL